MIASVSVPTSDAADTTIPPTMEATRRLTETGKDSDLDFDVEAMLSSLVSVRSHVPDDALTASVLGTERMGNGVVIGDRGLVLTIGYLVTEAQTLWITDRRGAAYLVTSSATTRTPDSGSSRPCSRCPRRPWSSA